MTVFQYTAISRSGAKLAGEIEEISRENVLAHLQELGHFPVEVREAGRKTLGGSQATSLFSGRPSAAKLTLFTRELAMLLKAGMPLAQSLDLLAKDAGSAKLSRLITQLNTEINAGKSLHEAMAAQAGVFPPVYTNMVRVAEASGTLDSVLERIAQARQRAEKLRSKALSAVLYPALLVIVAIAAVTILLTYVVPRFKDMMMQTSADIPDAARMIFAASDWLNANGLTLIVALFAAIFALIIMLQQASSRRMIESVLLRLPLIGNIIRLGLTIRFCRNLGVLLENSVELPVAMKLIRDVIGNRIAEAALDQAYDDLRKGRSFLEPLAHSGLFPPVVVNMLRVGEETGGLTQALQHMAEMFEDKLDTTVQRSLTILEPVIILMVSGFVATVIISILSAIISMNDLVL